MKDSESDSDKDFVSDIWSKIDCDNDSDKESIDSDKK